MYTSFHRDKWLHPIRCRKRHRMQDSTRRSGRDMGCPSRNSNRQNARFSKRSSQSVGRYTPRAVRSSCVGSYQTTNLVGVTLFADTPGAMDSMACRETTVCRDKWGEQWSSNRVHRAVRVDLSLMKGLRCRLSLNMRITHRKEESRKVREDG